MAATRSSKVKEVIVFDRPLAKRIAWVIVALIAAVVILGNWASIKTWANSGTIISTTAKVGIPVIPAMPTIAWESIVLPDGKHIPVVKCPHTMWVVDLSKYPAEGFTDTGKTRKPLATAVPIGKFWQNRAGYLAFDETGIFGYKADGAHGEIVATGSKGQYVVPFDFGFMERDEWIVFLQDSNSADNLPVIYRVVRGAPATKG